MNAVSPGTIRTAAWDQRASPRSPTSWSASPAGTRCAASGTPEEVAAAICFLASDEASFISGVVLRVDGGLLAGLGGLADELLVESRHDIL